MCIEVNLVDLNVDFQNHKDIKLNIDICLSQYEK